MATIIHHLYSDIWQEIFEYFNPIELFHSLLHVTNAADELLLNRNHCFFLRRLIADPYIDTLPKKLVLSQIISLELYQESPLDIIDKCSKLRSLKLIGKSEWVVYLLKNISYVNMELERLVLVVPDIGSLYDLLGSVTSLFSLRRLAIHANKAEAKIKGRSWALTQTNVEHFSLHSCSSVSWNELSYMLPGLFNIRFLDMTLFYDKNKILRQFIFPQLRYARLQLLEIPFEWIIRLVKTMPSLIKLKLNGLVDVEGFVIDHKWHILFESCASLNIVIVNLSLERDTNFYCTDMIQETLQEINLNLTCIDDDCDCGLDGRNQYRWWTLSGRINKECSHTKLGEKNVILQDRL